MWRARALAAAAVIPVSLETMSLARIERVLARVAGLSNDLLLDDLAAAQYVDGILVRLPPPWRLTCLRRAAVLYYLLRSGGKEVDLCIGVRRDADGVLRAHAWLTRNGLPYLESDAGADRVADYSEIARFPTTPWERGTRQDTHLLIETLRLGVHGDRDSLAARWRAADQMALVQLAKTEGAALWLQRRLMDAGIALSDAAQSALGTAAKKAVVQGMRVEGELAAVLETLGAVGVEAIPLKSCALRSMADRIPYADARAPVDVDVLVEDDKTERAWEAMTRAGYKAPLAEPESAHHLAALVGASGVGVEIHRSTMPGVPPSEAWRRATEDGRRRIPSDTELLWHAIVHGVKHIEMSARGGLRLRHWLDAAALISSSDSIDWRTIRSRLASPECDQPRIATAWLLTAAQFSARPLPADALDQSDIRPIHLARVLNWRLRATERQRDPRWTQKLLEEGARGEVDMPFEPPQASATRYPRLRHWFAVRLARVWWRLNR